MALLEKNKAEVIGGMAWIYSNKRSINSKTPHINDKHKDYYKFKEGDLVWLYLRKRTVKSKGRKLNPIRYGHFKILKKTIILCNKHNI